MLPSDTKTCLLTRPVGQSEPFAAKLHEVGFRVLFQPAIDILPPENFWEIDAAIERLTGANGPGFDWVFFVSRNAVAHFFARMEQVRPEWRDRPPFSGTVKIAVVGQGTAGEFFTCTGRKPDVFSTGGDAGEMLVQVLRNPIYGRRFLILRADRGRDIFRSPLREAGAAEVSELAVYRSVDRADAEPEIVRELAAGRINYTTATSSAIAASLVRLFGESLHKTRLVSISPLTSRTLAELGFPPWSEAAAATPDALIEAILT